MKTFFRFLGYFSVFLAIGLVAGYFVHRSLHFNKTGEVPLLVGKSITESAETLNRRKLFLSIEGKVHNDEVPEGFIVKQDMAAGKEVPVGSEIGVYVSKGPEVYSMPSFEGQFLEDAKLTLLNLGMKVRKVTWVHSDSVEKDKIIAQRPLPGNITSNEMNFLVSLGHYAVSYKCPSFVNMTIDDAKILASELGLELSEKKKGSRVIFQKPEEGSIIKRGAKVEITLGRGWGMWF